jgi:tetratricopeptide (TPR) repeat protein
VFVAVAMDTGGIPACKPFYDKAGATYLSLVDPQNALGEAFDFDAIPNGFLIDEAGVLRYKRVGGFEVSSPATQKAIDDFLALPPAKPGEKAVVRDEKVVEAELRAALSKTPDDPAANLALGRLLLQRSDAIGAAPFLARAAALAPKSSGAHFSLGSAYLALGKKEAAGASLKTALRYDRANFVIRKQIWMIEHPEKFHPTIDWTWQRAQLAKEREAEKNDPPSLTASGSSLGYC